jgi:hypothetical protein
MELASSIQQEHLPLYTIYTYVVDQSMTHGPKKISLSNKAKSK